MTRYWRYLNFNRLSIGYAFRPHLRPRLTLRGRTFLRKPQVYGGQDSHLSFRYSYRHSLFRTLHGSLRYRFAGYATLPYHLKHVQIRDFGSWLQPRTFSARFRLTSELLRTLSMNGCF